MRGMFTGSKIERNARVRILVIPDLILSLLDAPEIARIESVSGGR